MSVDEKPATRLWREALTQLEELLEKPLEQRVQRLADIQRTQPELHSMLVSLIDADDRARRTGFLDPPPMKKGALAPGAQLGPYRIESRIGAGGMGEVWLASRDDGLYQGQVAIKTLHPYFGGGALRERFLREALILGRLQHPGIARLLDAGVAADGGVYLVIEYVRGAAIDAWCDERKLDVEARLQLFLEVCSAVTQAHANLIVHRDIKPSNILVAGDGQVKLLDFGVAKLLEADPPAGQAELTRMTGRIFTPEYAAPEQILGEPITTATDVYSLGVLLHVLLTGARPLGISDNPVEIERAVLHDEPVRASVAVSQDGKRCRRAIDLGHTLAARSHGRPRQHRFAGASQEAAGALLLGTSAGGRRAAASRSPAHPRAARKRRRSHPQVHSPSPHGRRGRSTRGARTRHGRGGRLVAGAGGAHRSAQGHRDQGFRGRHLRTQQHFRIRTAQQREKQPRKSCWRRPARRSARGSWTRRKSAPSYWA